MGFDRLIGAPADVNELEYVSALHQTDVQNGIRKDGSINDDDVSLFLASRYGVKQTPQEVYDKIFQSMASTDRSLDMMQLVSLLLIPTLREVEEETKKWTTDSTTTTTNRGGAGATTADSKEEFLELSLEMLLLDVTGCRKPKILTNTLIRQILMAFGETELAENEILIAYMLHQAGGDGTILNIDTFRRVLTSDIQCFNPKSNNNTKPTMSNFRDVFLSNNESKSKNNNKDTKPTTLRDVLFSNESKLNDDDNNQLPSMINRETKVNEIPIEYTAPNLDGAAEKCRSRPKIIFQWLFFLLTFQTYFFRIVSDEFIGLYCPRYDPQGNIFQNFGKFLCLISVNILQWVIVMFLMGCSGLAYFCIGGISNSIECRNPKLAFVDVIVAAMTTFLPWYFIGRQTPWDDLSTNPSARAYVNELLQFATSLCGICTVFLSIWEFLSILDGRGVSIFGIQQSTVLVPDMVKAESQVRHAASYKIKKMIENALDIHRTKVKESVMPTHFGQALLNFNETEPEVETIGGFVWCWRMIFSRELPSLEGVVLGSRLLSANITQIAVIPFVLISGSALTYVAQDEFQNFINYIDSQLQSSGLDLDLVSITENTTDAITTSLATGTTIAVLTATVIAAATVPSAVATVLKLRCGMIPFVKDKMNTANRIAPDQVAYLKGIMFWGCFYSSISMGTLMSIIVFVFVWEVTAASAQNLLAIIIGALLALLVNAIIVKSLRRVSSQAYYRYRPAISNFAILARECGFLALTQGFVFFRVFKLLIAAILYIGRVDVPFLHEDRATVAGLRLDGEPYMFLIDTLMHEAHRHPYIETLGTMYLLKLKHGNKFINTGGSTWRLILLYILMPWLAKYRAVRKQLNAAGEHCGKDSFRGRPESESDVERPHLRAESLYDPQAFTLRMASLVPVAHGYAGSMALTLASDRRSRAHTMRVLPSYDEEMEEAEVQGLQAAQLRNLEPHIAPHRGFNNPIDDDTPQQRRPQKEAPLPPRPPRPDNHMTTQNTNNDDDMAGVLPPAFGQGLNSTLLLRREDKDGLEPLRAPGSSRKESPKSQVWF